MRLFPLLFALAIAASAPAGAAWHTESSQPVATASPAIRHLALSLRNGGPETPALQVRLVELDRARCTLRVLDLESGQTVAEGAAAAHALAATNGGYFHPDRTPLGLVVSGGKTLHPWEKSKLLTGVLAVPAKGVPRLLRNSEYRLGGLREALQTGPFLVDHGKTLAGLNATKAAERTVVLADRKGVRALLITGPVTLAGLGELLATPGLFEGLEIDRALNLDGGSSTALWSAPAGRDAAFSHPEWKRVRNAVIVVPR